MTRGRPEVTCGAQTRSGGECGRAAGHGTDHRRLGRCSLHGGSTPSHIRAAQLERIEMETARIAERYGLPRVVDVPGALLELLHAQAGIVDLWDSLVRGLDDLSEPGIGGAVEIHRYVRAAERARRDYARIAVDAARLGIEAKRAALDEQDRRLVIEIIEGAVHRLGANPQQPDVHDAIVAAIDDVIAAVEADTRVADR